MVRFAVAAFRRSLGHNWHEAALETFMILAAVCLFVLTRLAKACLS
jgi:hypothetical protein